TGTKVEGQLKSDSLFEGFIEIDIASLEPESSFDYEAFILEKDGSVSKSWSTFIVWGKDGEGI
ncbi:MAG: hypothetical protein IJ584_07410, partial [Bacteroidales bacterium]|nr:hypothetical protein [Bacteroidales bacterium]